MKFRKKPVVIEAVQWDGTPEVASRIVEWSQGDAVVAYPAHYADPQLGPGMMLIRTFEGNLRASVGDWIIKGVQGEFYPCKPDIFEATYDSVNAERDE